MIKLIYRIAAGKIRRDFGNSDKKRDAGQTTPADILRFDNIVYANDKKFPKWQLLDVYRPKSAGEMNVGSGLKPLPVIVVVHGGAWVYGNKDVYQFYGMRLAQRGFAVVNYSYRLAPETRFPASIQDTESVFRWISDNAQKYGLDTKNVFAVGDSAGGHLLSLYASALTNSEYRQNFPFIGEKNLTLRGVALNCGKYKMDVGLDKDPQMRMLIEALMPNKGTKEELRLIDGSAHVTKDFPPAFVMTCKGDFLLSQAPYMKHALEEAGVRHEYRCYGTEERPLQHVFHCDPVMEEAVVCNDEECSFFRSLIVQD